MKRIAKKCSTNAPKIKTEIFSACRHKRSSPKGAKSKSKTSDFPKSFPVRLCDLSEDWGTLLPP